MVLRRFVLCVLAPAALAAFQAAHAQPVRSCPDGQAVQSLNPNGTPVNCVPVPPPVNLAPVNAAIAAEATARAAADVQLQANISAEAAARQGMDATLLGAIQTEAQARQAAIEALQPGAPTGTTRCYAVHFVRNGGDEVHFTVLFFNNGDLQNHAVVERITIRDDLGNTLHDSGPKIGTPHPFATAPIPPLDITNVPPGATFGLSTSDIWGFNSIPQLGGGTRSISMTAEVTKAGDPKLFTVHARQIARQRVVLPTGATVAAERSNNDSTCFSVPRT
jgi:hypothetical protein